MAKEPELTISESTQTFHDLIAATNVDDALRTELHKADVVILPADGWRGEPGPMLPVGTEELLHTLRDSGVAADVAVDEGKYRELALHGALLIIGTLLVKSGAAAAAIKGIVNFVRKRAMKPKEDSVRAEIIIATEDGRSLKVNYDGPADVFEDTVQKALAAPAFKLLTSGDKKE